MTNYKVFHKVAATEKNVELNGTSFKKHLVPHIEQQPTSRFDFATVVNQWRFKATQVDGGGGGAKGWRGKITLRLISDWGLQFTQKEGNNNTIATIKTNYGGSLTAVCKIVPMFNFFGPQHGRLLERCGLLVSPIIV